MFKYTKSALNKIEQIFSELDYTVRYEKGNFKSGYCIVEDRKIAIINKFYDTEARINSLLDIMNNIEIDESQLEEKSAVFYNMLTTKVLSELNASEEMENPA